MIDCFAKAIHSRVKLRTANSLFVRPFVIVLSDTSRQSLWNHNEKCVLFKVKRYSYVLGVDH